MADPFLQFGGQATETADPFAEFGGSTVSSEKKPEEITPELLGEEEFRKIGAKYGVDPEELRSLAPYYGAKVAPRSFPEALEQGAKGAVGFVGSGPLLNIPQFVHKKLQNEPTRKALDELREIALQQQTPIETAAEMIAGPAGAAPKALTSTAARRLGGAIGLGTAAGVGGSKEGEEVKGAATGAAFGGVIGGAVEGLGAVLNKMKPNKIEQELASRTEQFNIDKGVEDIASRTGSSEKAMEELAFGNKSALSREEIDKLLKEQLGEEKLDKYLNPATEEGALIRDRIEGPVNDQSIREHLTDEITGNRARDFAEDLTGTRPKNVDQAIDDIDQYMNRQGREATLDRYKEYVKVNQAERYIGEAGIRAVDEPNFFGKAANSLSDNQFVYRNFDDKYGTHTEDIIRQLNKDYNRSTFALQDFRNKYDGVYQQARKLGTDDVVINTNRVYSALDTGKTAGLSREELETVKAFKEYFDNIRGFVNGVVKEKDPRIAPLSIPYRENYVPHMLKPTPEMIVTMEKKINQAAADSSRTLGRDIKDLAQINPKEFMAIANDPNVKDLIAAVKIFDNREIRNAADLSSRLKEMLYTRDGNIALESAARAAMEREGQIPDFLKEKNLYKLARRYTDNTIRHLYLRNGIDKLRYQSKALKKAGADVAATYIDNNIRDLLGVRKGTAAEAMSQLKIQSALKLDRLIEQYGKDSTRGAILNMAKAAPDFFYFLSRQIYPNVLGYFNLRAALQNATTGVTKLAPELGNKYGYSTTLRGAVYTLGNLKRLVEKADRLGSTPAEFTRKGEAAIAEGIARTSPVRLSKAVLEGAGKAGMILFEKTEKFNRALTMGIGELMGRDIARGSNLALESLNKFPRNVRKEVLANRGNAEAMGEILAKYLNDVTQYNYNKVSMSEFGRTMGPLFSQFSKWPTATVGDILYEMRDKGLFKSMPRNMEKYIAPFLLLQSVDYILGERIGDKESLTPTQKKLIGTFGLSQSAPIGAAGGILKGEIFTPPIVDAVVQSFLHPVIEGDAAKLEKGISSVAGNFTPFAGLFRLITDDLVTYATGERPEGSSFIERTAHGAERLIK